MVGVKIYNCFEVEANSSVEAETQVREMDLYDTFADCDYNIVYVDEVHDFGFKKERDIPKEMCQDLLDLEDKKDNE